MSVHPLSLTPHLPSFCAFDLITAGKASTENKQINKQDKLAGNRGFTTWATGELIYF